MKKNNIQKGIIFALCTAVISGISIFINSYAVMTLKNPYIFTTAKNIIVGLVFVSALLLAKQWSKIKKLKIREWILLLFIGIIGGSIPFLLFFKGMSMGNVGLSAFIHKTIFVWVALLAIPLLKEKISFWHIVVFGMLVLGAFFQGNVINWTFGSGAQLILIAVLLWSIEVIIVKKLLKNIDVEIAAAARMFFGGMIMIGYLISTNQAKFILQNNSIQWIWIFVTSAFLLGYVTFWYSALKNAPAILVTCILTLGLPITTILESVFINHTFSNIKLEGFIFSVTAVLFFIIFYYRPDWFYFKLKKT